MNARLFLLLLIPLILFSCDKEDRVALKSIPQIPEDSIKVTRIWDNDKYCSFTSLVKYQGEYYCAFREGVGHGGDNGSIRILKSLDATNWKEAFFLSHTGFDLRDPNLSVMPDGRLMLICGCQTNSLTRTVVSFLPDKDSEFTEFQEVKMSGELSENCNWIWRATWFDDVCYGVRYGDNHADLYQTKDGINWGYVSTIAHEVTEVQLGRKTNGDLVALARTGSYGLVCYSSSPYKEWVLFSANIILQGQALFVTSSDRMVCVSRSYYDNDKTTLFCNVTHRAFAKLCDFPSGGGDTCYAGIICEDDRLLISYYSCHYSYSDIYLAEIPLKCLKDRGIW